MMHSDYMETAIELAREAERMGEVPIGAIVVQDGAVVGRGFNRRETGKNALYHAEMIAIDEACRALGGWRLPRCALYVTLEPCPMCAGAIVQSRIDLVVFGAFDPKAGAFGSVFDLSQCPLNHRPAVQGGVEAERCAALLQNFFRQKRER